MSQQISNSSAVIRDQVYSQFLIENLAEIMLPEGMARDVSDFGDGNTLNIPTVGSVTLQEAAEGTPLTFNPIDSGTVSLTIAEYPGDAWSVTDDLKEDGYLVERLMMERTMESSRAMAEYFETKFLAACNDAQTQNAVNNINGIQHRLRAGNGDGAFELGDFAFMKYAFDKAKVPQAGRIAIVDPSVEYELNKLYNGTWVTNNPSFAGIVTEGFAQSHKFVTNIFGFDIWTSNLLPVVGVETVVGRDGGAASGAAATDVANIFMCVASDQTKPIMKAWRRMPKVESWRDHEERKDKIQTTARFGLGAQRVDTLGVITSSI